MTNRFGNLILCAEFMIDWCSQKAMIAKFRDRWEKLKESAKRKKSARASGDRYQ